jgi:hypothetical protein
MRALVATELDRTVGVHGGAVVLDACHDGRVVAGYAGKSGVLDLRCATCERVVVRVAVAVGHDPACPAFGRA